MAPVLAHGRQNNLTRSQCPNHNASPEEIAMINNSINRSKLDLAFRSCGCTGDLDAALTFPALAIALKNVAETIEANKPRPKPRYDFKRAIAGDFDD